MAKVEAFVAEHAPGAHPRWSAHTETERPGGADFGEEVHGDDPEALLAWARERTDVVYVRFWDSGSWWAGSGEPPPFDADDPLDSEEDYEGPWPPPPDSVWGRRLRT